MTTGSSFLIISVGPQSAEVSIKIRAMHAKSRCVRWPQYCPHPWRKDFPKMSIFWLWKDSCELCTLGTLEEKKKGAASQAQQLLQGLWSFCPGLNNVDGIGEGPREMYLSLSCILGHWQRKITQALAGSKEWCHLWGYKSSCEACRKALRRLPPVTIMARLSHQVTEHEAAGPLCFMLLPGVSAVRSAATEKGFRSKAEIPV